MDIFAAIEREQARQRDSINLIASENQVSERVLKALGTVLMNKYAEGYPGKRYYGGCVNVDAIESYACELAQKLFGADHANVQPHSGTQANMAAYLTLLKPGDKVLAFSLAHGGHLSHGAPFNFSGQFYNFVHYGVNKETGLIDEDEIHAQFKANPDIKLMVAGASSYPRAIDFERLGGIAKSHGAMLMADIAHISGLVAAKQHPDPVPYADAVTMSTHKTIRGPRGGLAMCRKEHAKKLDKAVFPGCQGGPLEHVIAGKAIMLEEASKPEFVAYIKEVLAAAKELAAALTEINPKRFRVLTGGTDNHMVLIDVTGEDGLNGQIAEQKLEKAGIYVNKNFIPFDPLPSSITSGIRIGTPMLVTQGYQASDMREIAEKMDKALSQ